MTDDLIERVEPKKAFEALKAFKERGYNVLVDLTALDYSAWDAPRADAASFRMYSLAEDPKRPRPLPAGRPRFKVVYRLLSLDPATGLERGRAEVHCAVKEGEASLRSAASLWPAADWLEREIWDMFGIGFSDRPGIKRILMYEGFAGHPLRKDYPIAKRQPLIGPPSGEAAGVPTFNQIRPTITGE